MIQIICTILTFLGALGLLGLNQWFAARHKQTEVLSVKLEELYSVLERISALGTPRADPDLSLAQTLKDMRSEAEDALRECKRVALLIALYFPDLEGRWKSVFEAAEAAFCEMADFRMGSDYDYIWGQNIEAKHQIGELLDHITLEAASLTKRIFS